MVHFLNPIEGESETAMGMNLTPYKDALDIIEQRGKFEHSELTNLLAEHPEAFDLFEQILQLSNFTTAQWTHMMFDLDKLNSSDITEVMEYLLLNLGQDDHLRDCFVKKKIIDSGGLPGPTEIQGRERILLVLKAKQEIARLSKNRDSAHLHSRLLTIKRVRERVANYLLDAKGLNSVLEGVRPRAYLTNKRKAADTKSAHGKYGSKILSTRLKDAKFKECGDLDICKQKMIRRRGTAQLVLSQDTEFCYCTEKQVESAANPGTSISSVSGSGKPLSKRFDFVLLYQGKPRVVIETNFYTTSGSKIGVNEKEYLSLQRYIKQNEKGLRFIWVTDGNYWLTSTGRRMFERLVPDFEDSLMNFGTLTENLRSIRKQMSKAED
jgi:SOS response regulatory protein OraA/RecX